eukprot:CAMPEP_0202046642 /NCGR_PEP_ID=MMETSP0963-20130614/1435_1 /ASSEMBLY_ACC=CAM_ASM_000494 /TAXON_ID=4773 /ORGANISM="Schizochytrium aggregatum, Strain ATCC28209" /LENGTH=178 /DNA_ID=CAMNT_0048611309 /DNA_START=52 /DNA_END=586 /DNA_ORIENTATION=-
MGGYGPAPEVTIEEMKAAKLPINARDACAGLLIPLNRCRQATGYLPFKCGHERHHYEKCQYDEYKKRIKLMEQQRKAKRRASRESSGAGAVPSAAALPSRVNRPVSELTFCSSPRRSTRRFPFPATAAFPLSIALFSTLAALVFGARFNVAHRPSCATHSHANAFLAELSLTSPASAR